MDEIKSLVSKCPIFVVSQIKICDTTKIGQLETKDLGDLETIAQMIVLWYRQLVYLILMTLDHVC